MNMQRVEQLILTCQNEKLGWPQDDSLTDSSAVCKQNPSCWGHIQQALGHCHIFQLLKDSAN